MQCNRIRFEQRVRMTFEAPAALPKTSDCEPGAPVP